MKLLIAFIVIGATIATVLVYKNLTIKNETVIEETVTDRDFTTDCWPDMNKGR